MKKIIAISLLVFLVIFTVGCGKKTTTDDEVDVLAKPSVSETKTTEIPLDLTEIDSLEQDLDLSDLEDLESDLDLEI